MNIGRRIYYEKQSGNIILDTGERQGNVVETTVEQDFKSYKVLAERVPETVGVIELDFGQYADKFGYYEYHVDPETGQIVWGDLINPDIVPPGPTLEEMQAQTLLNTEYLVCMSEINNL